MTKRKWKAGLLASVATLSIFAATPSRAADEWIPYSKQGWWDIGYDYGDNGSLMCNARIDYKSGLVLQWAAILKDSSRTWVMALWHKDWKVTEGHTYEIRFKGVNKKDTFKITFTGTNEHGMMAFVETAQINALVSDRDDQAFELSSSRGRIGLYNAKGSAAAVRDVVHCTRDPKVLAGRPKQKQADKQPQNQQQNDEPLVSGSGFFVAPGRVLTNYHVVESCPVVRVRFGRSRRSGARDATRDFSLLDFRENPDGKAI